MINENAKSILKLIDEQLSLLEHEIEESMKLVMKTKKIEDIEDLQVFVTEMSNHSYQLAGISVSIQMKTDYLYYCLGESLEKIQMGELPEGPPHEFLEQLVLGDSSPGVIMDRAHRMKNKAILILSVLKRHNEAIFKQK